MDKFTEVSSEGWGSRLMSSIKGVLVGIVLFIVAFPLLFWNEGRAVKRAQDLSEGRGAVVSVSADQVDPEHEGDLVHLTGTATTEETLADPEFGVSVDSAIALERNVEMYQWEEIEKEETRKKAGGKTETITTYEYEKTWTDSLIDSSSFRKPEGHDNPRGMPYESTEQWADHVTLGDYDLGSLAGQLSSWSNYPVNNEIRRTVAGRALRNLDGGFYLGQDPHNPEIGDMRINFQVIEPTTVSVVAVQSGDSFRPFEGSSGSTIYRLVSGEQTADQMFQKMEAENTMMLWVIRVLGFLLMFGGISAVFKPLVVVADVVPIFGDLLEWGVGLLAFVIAAPLTMIVIAAGWVAYRPLIGITLIVLALGIIGGGVMMAKKRKAG